MIKFKDKSLINDIDNKLVNYLSLAYTKSIDCIKNYLNSLNIDESIFNHLYDIDIDIIIKDSKSFVAYYLPSDNELKINLSYSYLNFVVETNDLYQLVLTLIHELLHINRSIILKNSIQCSLYIDDYYETKIEKNYLNKPKLVSDYSLKYTYNDLNSINDEFIIIDNIIRQYGLEEALTECTSRIILYSNLCNNYDINSIIDVVYKNTNVLLIKICLKMFKNKEFVRWFLLSCYEDEYFDYIEYLYKENYDEIVDLIDLLYYEEIESKTIISKDKALKLEYLLSK